MESDPFLGSSKEQEKLSFTFWKNTVLALVFAVATPLTILISIFTLQVIGNDNSAKPRPVSPVVASTASVKNSGVQVFASLPTSYPAVAGAAEVDDARVEIVRNYLKSYNSILEPFADTLVAAADHYRLDYRLLPAIAQQESNLCKWIPEDTHNCWGWGIHKEGTLGFKSFDEAIWTVAEGLRENYLDKGYITPSEIMSKYTPSSNGSWAAGVTEFMAEME